MFVLAMVWDQLADCLIARGSGLGSFGGGDYNLSLEDGMHFVGHGLVGVAKEIKCFTLETKGVADDHLLKQLGREKQLESVLLRVLEELVNDVVMADGVDVNVADHMIHRILNVIDGGQSCGFGSRGR